jgi:NADPH2:quinone reductase
MKAMVCPGFGATLELREVETPRPGPGEVLISVTACGVNFADGLMIDGRYQMKREPPFIPGLEVSGRVAECGPGIAGLLPGQRVVACLSGGGFAEAVVAAAADVLPLPDGLDPVVAAGVPVAYGTSHLALTGKAGLAPGETLVVHGAAGGVGLTAVEIGKALGARVIATASGPERIRLALDHGADHGLDSRAADLREQIKALTGGRGADVVFDPVGGPLFEASLRSIAPDGRILVIGFASGTVPQIPANILLVKNVTVIGFDWGAYRRLAPERVRASLAAVLDGWSDGRLAPLVSEVLPLDRAADALERLRDRRVAGKIVLSVG